MAYRIYWLEIHGSAIGKYLGRLVEAVPLVLRPRAFGLVWEGSIGRYEVFGEEK